MQAFTQSDYIIVTGASSGIGRDTAIKLNAEGANVIGIGRNLETLEQTRQLCPLKENFYSEVADLSKNIDKLPQYILSLRDKYPPFKALICCAGIIQFQPLRMLSYDDLQTMFNINCFSPLMLAKGFADKRVHVREDSSIIFVSSISSLSCEMGLLSYAASKAAANTAFKTMGRELASMKIRVNTISPSEVATPMSEIASEVRGNCDADYPFGIGKVENISSFIIYLLSQDAKWLTCQNYILDCGSV